MKKNFIYFAITLLMGLFAACSQEEAPGASSSSNNLVNISAELPSEFAQTRAIPEVTDHYLRCILEISDADGNQVYREEKLGTEATNGKLSFTFALENAGTYNYMMWADFIPAEGQSKDQVTGRYADKFYNTEDLTKVTIKDASLLYNSDACDAFSSQGSFEKSQASLENPLNVTLTRPFAKLIVSDKSKANFDKCQTVAVSQKIPAAFNVSTGKVSTEMIDAIMSATEPIGTSETTGETTDLQLFSCYVFAEDDVLGEIALTFVTEDGGRTVAIPANVPVKKNTRTQVRGYFIAESSANTQIDTDFGEWKPDIDGGDLEPVVPTVNPEIGDFYYKDGTYSAELKEDAENPCVGIVFATTPLDGDVASNYGSEYTAIKGYVVALESAPTNTRLEFCAKGSDIDFTGMELNKTGYENTKAFFADERYTNNTDKYPVIEKYLAFKTNTPTPEKSSGWYIPSINQLKEMTIGYYGFEETAKNETFVNAINAIEGANLFVHTTTSARYLLSSSVSNKSISPITLTNNVLDANTKIQPIFNTAPDKAGVQGQIRPILTILE